MNTCDYPSDSTFDKNMLNVIVLSYTKSLEYE